MTPTLTRTDGRSVLRLGRRLRHAPSHVWRALTEPDRLADWFPGAVTIDLRPAGRSPSARTARRPRASSPTSTRRG